MRAAIFLCIFVPVVWAAEPEPRVVQVSGTAEVRAEPDRAVVALGVEAHKPTLDAARSEVTRGIDAVLKLTHELKIDSKDVRTTRLTVQPEYDWNNTARERRLIGYYVSRQADVVVRNLDQLGLLLERAVTAGANSVGEPRLESSHQHDLERQALALAVEDARLNAETATRAANAKLGPVHMIDTVISRAPVPILTTQAMSVRAGAADSDKEKTYQAGEITFNASVRVQYDLVAN